MQGRLFIGALARPDAPLEALKRDMETEFGSIVSTTDAIPWAFSDYYQQEMGTNLLRFFVAFEKRVQMADLVAIREQTGQIEQTYAKQGKRTVNLDPGIVTQEQVLLASSKPGRGKTLLANGVYIHPILVWNVQTFLPLPHCFPDYRTEAYRGIFTQIRALLHKV